MASSLITRITSINEIGKEKNKYKDHVNHFETKEIKGNNIVAEYKNKKIFRYIFLFKLVCVTWNNNLNLRYEWAELFQHLL